MENILYQKWDEILEHMRVNFGISGPIYRTFIEILSIYSIDGDNLTILMDDTEIGDSREYVKNKYSTFLTVTIEEITGIRYNLIFLSLTVLNTQSNNDLHAPNNSKVRLNPAINPDYTFDNFIVGDNNNYAHAASLKVAEEPGSVYNPLYIYGEPGLGKTHLMHAIANFILKHDSSKKLIYVTSEKFTNEIVDAIRDSKNEHSTARQDFRNKYRNVDVLLIDDIQFIIGKESTQEEFFHTFNELYAAQKQIVITSDKHPSKIEMLDERYSSRFQWGLTADIKAPTYETKMAILRKKVAEENINIDDAILDYIANNILSNIRELQGAITKVMSFSNLCEKQITMELAREALVDMINPNVKRQVTVEYIEEIVAEHFGITVNDLNSSKRNSSIVYPRDICMYLCRELTNNTLAEIGKKLGNRHHSTILNGIEKIEKKVENAGENAELIKTIDVLHKKINP